MKLGHLTIPALVFVASCIENSRSPGSDIESAQAALGTVPPSEIAIWQKLGASSMPGTRYLHAAAFDEARKVLVIFGGLSSDPRMGNAVPNQETWEWSPATGKWTNRTGALAPDIRSGAAMVYDSARAKLVLFGGRSGSGYNLEDVWEWDPATGLWTNVTASGVHPSARSQHGMVYEKSTGKILLFGGGRSDPASYDGTAILVSSGETWEYDPANRVWAQPTPTVAPSARHDLGLVWDSARSKAVLFGGMQTDIAGASGIPKQDIWEWDPATTSWTERTAAGDKPSQRFAHAMAFDGNHKRALVFGGWDIGSGGMLGDLWEWDPESGAWTERLTGAERGLPSPRVYAALVADDADARLELVAGMMALASGSPDAGVIILPVPSYGATGSREVWELNAAIPAFTDRTSPLDLPSQRYNHAMAYYPPTGKTYVFGGTDSLTGQYLNDLWEWNGKTWAQVATDVQPSGRAGAALAYDPVRKSLILFGGSGYSTVNDTWEWGAGGKWTQLAPSSSPDALYGPGMVTDTTRNRILLFAGISYLVIGIPGRVPVNPMRNEVWEWDGTAMAWSNRTPLASASAPTGRSFPVVAYDEGRRKMVVYDGNVSGSVGSFWEWDPVSAGWARRDTGDVLDRASQVVAAHDSIRRRTVFVTDVSSQGTGYRQTWELDAKGPTWYIRALPDSPGGKYGATMSFDSTRGVMVLFGGQDMMTGAMSNETWEYKVSNLGNGEGCTSSFASSCASGNCVEGVCCEVATCTGACQSCNVAGSEGTCVAAKAGTEVAGSCADNEACDGSGSCKTKNGRACTSATACASGNCVDGVCCDNACTGTCASCNLAGRAGTCSPYPAGSDPQSECGQGTGVCQSTCDGVGACAYPTTTVTCSNCYTCDGRGSCSNYNYYCGIYVDGGPYPVDGGWDVRPITTDGPVPILGTGGYRTGLGGSGGSRSSTGGAIGRGGSGGSPSSGGFGGHTVTSGGNGGAAPNAGGNGGSTAGRDGGGNGGTTGNRDGGADDAGSSATLHKSGCGCEVAPAGPRGGSTPLLVGAGLALLLVRRRRSRR